jgi:mannose-6-phosphate isomerase-like protein (cupin superfamily)
MLVRGTAVQPIDFEGLEIHDYTAGQGTSSSLAVIRVPPAGRHRRARSQRSDKYYYVISGQLHFTLEKDELDLAAGDFVLVAQNRSFWYENRTTEPAVLLLVHTPALLLSAEVFVD